METTVKSVAYEAMKNEMEKGTYSEVEAKKTLTTMYAKKMLTEEEYNELMDIATELNANTAEGEWRNEIVALKEAIDKNTQDIALIKQAMEEGGTVIPEPEPEPDGSEFNPITASPGIMYYKDKYYSDPSKNNEVYLCFRDSDTEPGTGIRLDFYPSQLVNIYFHFVRV